MSKRTREALSPAECERIAEQILELREPANFKMSGKALTQGQFVVTGMQQGERRVEKHIGFCVQVRVGRGQFGSDMVFLRHPDESLTTHENQSFYVMTAEQETLARQIFSQLPEDEDFTGGYRCCDKIHEVGFLVENSQSRPSTGSAAMVKLTTVNERGEEKTTVTAFI
ncbi:hypothetical protein [Burkholderia cenocepacia]|uniref:hypothetical protein n=1 Tax=Burkholderia cenocepacia TaxID=95486 RepID=UPI000761C7CE|nr:hypothetical protein [Burkholderia cenocepacia]KWU19154.1 hypothetical protein AS149_12975 [Burkholderia cenocepacia]